MKYRGSTVLPYGFYTHSKFAHLKFCLRLFYDLVVLRFGDFVRQSLPVLFTCLVFMYRSADDAIDLVANGALEYHLDVRQSADKVRGTRNGRWRR